AEIHQLVRQYGNEESSAAPFEVEWSYKQVHTELPAYPEGIDAFIKRCEAALHGTMGPFIEEFENPNSQEKDVAVIMVTHGWCLNCIQNAVAKQKPIEAGYCAITRC